MKIGVITDCFKKTHSEGIAIAAELGLQGVQIYATTGDFSPALSKTEKEDGDNVYYVEESNEFVVISQDGYIRTYFNPSAGIDYFNRQ